MVATRRGARTGPVEEVEMEDATHNLRKKPVRKATAAKAAIATKATATTTAKPRATRSKAVNPEPEADVKASDVDELMEEAAPVPKRTTRSRRAETVEPEESQPNEAQQPALKPQRTTRTKPTAKTSKAESTVEDAPALQPSMASKPVRQTRAKAQAAKPLSPKKITQVSKARTRNAKPADEVKSSKTAKTRATSGLQDTRTGRKRTVSDENADLGDHMHSKISDVDSDVIEACLSPVKESSPRKASPTKAPKAPSEASMSSRATTPAQSPAPAFEQPSNYSEDHMDDARSEADDESEVHEASGSDDELAGAQTPMKRSTQRDEARYFHSAQKSVRTTQPATETKTPAPRFGRQTAKRGTPQTQKAYSKPAVPVSDTRPMNVARGEDRAFVFKALEQSTPSTSKAAVFAPEPVEEDAIEDSYEVQPDSPAHADMVSMEAEAEAMDAVESPFDDESVTHADDVNGPIVISDGEDESDLTVDSPTAEPPVAAYIPDVDETQVTADSEPMEPPVVAYESDESVLVTPTANRDGDYQSSADEAEDTFAAFDPKTPRPETIMWENLREDVTIPVNFDLHFADVRSPATDALTGNDVGTLDMSDLYQAEDGAVQEPEALEPVRAASTRNSTLNLNDFVDFAALAEPTVRLDLQAAAQSLVQTDHETDEQEQEADDAETSEKEDGDLNVIITRKPVAEAPQTTLSESEGEDQRQSLDTSLASHGQSPERATSAMKLEVHQDATPLDEESSSTEGTVELPEEEDVPHYARPTLAFDARRKSLPAFGHMTPLKPGSRPNTSDGASIARIVHPFEQPWWARSTPGSTTATPVRARPSTAHGSSPAKSVASPSKGQNHASPAKTPSKTPTKALASTPGERFPRRAAKEGYEEHAQTIAAPARFHTPGQRSARRPATVQRLASQTTAQRSPNPAPIVEAPVATPRTRYPRLAARENYEEHAKTVASAARFQSPAQQSPKRPSTVQRMPSQLKRGPSTPIATATPVRDESSPAMAPVETPTATAPVRTPKARFPRLAARKTYEEHASTVAAPARFHTPTQPSPKRPSTTTKAVSPRKNVTFRPSTPRSTHTPLKTPLKPPGTTPGKTAVPMTPHPAAPLRGILALVEVFTLDGASASAPFIALLQRLGAKTTRTWSDRVTHVVFKDGSPTTLQRVRLHNKEGKGVVHCVNSRWVSDCDAQSYRVEETDEAYAVDVTDVPRGGSRRRKSMEPSALLNIGGNIVRDRKSSFGRASIGRSSLGRSPIKAISFESPVKQTLETATPSEKESVGTFGDGDSEPATPAYLAKPETLVQMTAPMNRIRKLEIKGDGKGRRLTSLWE